MTFRTVDELLTRQMTGAAGPPAAEQLDLRLVRFARGVAVYEMPLRGEVCDPSGAVASGVLTTLAEAAMTAAATTTVADGRDESPLVLELCARFDRVVEGDESPLLRAEAVVMRTDSRSARVEAEVHCNGVRVATFEATYTRERRTRPLDPLPGLEPAGERSLAHA
ncbi:MAG: hotdog domain-containing protein [Thermoleophilaceae bacterium]